MCSQLVLRSPSDGTGTGDSWDFSGGDESVLHDCLAQLDAYLTPAPAEPWDQQRHCRVIDAEDRWLAAMLIFTDDMRRLGRDTVETIQAEAAWIAEGARQLAVLLPSEMDDLRASIEQRFVPL